jgi:hypothetical protein
MAHQQGRPVPAGQAPPDGDREQVNLADTADIITS